MSSTQELSATSNNEVAPNKNTALNPLITASKNSKSITNPKNTANNIANNNPLSNASSKKNINVMPKVNKGLPLNPQKTSWKDKRKNISISIRSPSGLSSHTTTLKNPSRKSLAKTKSFHEANTTSSNVSIQSFNSLGLWDGKKCVAKNDVKTTKSESPYLKKYSQSVALTIPGTSNTQSFPIPVSYVRYPNHVLPKSLTSIEKSKSFRALVEKAMKERKVFSCSGVYPTIRKALKRRGWVEKPKTLIYTRSVNSVYPLAKSNEESDVLWLIRALRTYHPDFVWVIGRDNIDWKLSKEQLINRFPKAYFTTKVGLADCLQQLHWFCEAGISASFFPRCYRLCLEEERQAFQDDFKLTTCMSYLRHFIQKYELKGQNAVSDENSHITQLSLDFACRQLGNYIRARRNEDIDWLLPPNKMAFHWETFISFYYAVVHDKKKIRFESADAIRIKFESAKKILEAVSTYWPQAQLDGIYNMWICKPGARSRGLGIKIMNNLESILDLILQNNFREYNWVVQKYIEKPMLIYKTKFDIRQWFLVVNWTPLTVWFYKESYLRFCSKPFVLENFHESIHLCNNSVQSRYKNSGRRNSNLPKENMWSSDSFQAYLKSIEKEDVWPQIYSKMKQAIVGVMLASQEKVIKKNGCYELYGADFMLTEDFQPWLIEINSCPCMAASTKVTAKLCTQCLEDTIKVVLDRKYDCDADTGKFEMIYKQNTSTPSRKRFNGHDLTIVGQKLIRNIDWPFIKSNPVSRVPSGLPKTFTSLPHLSSQSRSPLPLVNKRKTRNYQTLHELVQKVLSENQAKKSNTNITNLKKKKSVGNTTQNADSKIKIQNNI